MLLLVIYVRPDQQYNQGIDVSMVVFTLAGLILNVAYQFYMILIIGMLVKVYAKENVLTDEEARERETKFGLGWSFTERRVLRSATSKSLRDWSDGE